MPRSGYQMRPVNTIDENDDEEQFDEYGNKLAGSPEAKAASN